MKKSNINKEILISELETKSPKQIANKYGLNAETIRRKIREYGIKRSRHSHLINEEFFNTWSSDMAYILGFTFADGSINRKLHHNKLTYQLKDIDKEILDFIVNKIQPTRNIYSYTREDKRTNKIYKVIMVDFSSKKLTEALIKLGCVPNKTYKNINVPDVPEEFLGDFVRGLFDGDGCISTKSKLSCNICNNCDTFLEQLQQRIGFGKISYTSKPSRITFWSKENVEKLYKLMYHNKQCFKLNRKFKIFEEYLFCQI